MNAPDELAHGSPFVPKFLGTETDARFVLYYPPQGEPRGAVLFAPPFAEEMNKARRMVALQARRFQTAGWGVLIPDLFGTGDSAGDFGAARWAIWLEDLRQCLAWLRANPACGPSGDWPLLLWGLRGGCLLVSDLLRTTPDLGLAGGLFWQPVTEGALLLRQFLRLRTAAGLLHGQRETVAALLECLAQGETLEVAGYALAPELANAMAASRLEPPRDMPLAWLDVALDAQAPPAASTARLLETWRQQEVAVQYRQVGGAPFWSTQEIVEVPALLDASDAALRAWPSWS